MSRPMRAQRICNVDDCEFLEALFTAMQPKLPNLKGKNTEFQINYHLEDKYGKYIHYARGA